MSQFKHSHRRLKWIAPACAGLFLLSPARRLGQNGAAPDNPLPAHPAAVTQPAPAAPAAMSPVSLSGPCTGDACAGDVRVPTGELKTGKDLSSLTPSVAFWTDLGNAQQARGGVTLEVPTNHDVVRPDDILHVNFAVGTTLTGRSYPPFLADFTPYAAFNYLQQFGNGFDSSFFRVTPGIRSFVGWGAYFIVGYEIPVTGPRPFDQRLTFILSKGW